MTRVMTMLCALALLIGAATVAAQIPTGTYDLAALGLAGADMTPVDVDGNAATQEWLAEVDGQFRVVAVRATVCPGPWFNPRPNATARVKVGRLGAVDALIVRWQSGGNPFLPTDRLTTVQLVAPSCP